MMVRGIRLVPLLFAPLYGCSHSSFPDALPPPPPPVEFTSLPDNSPETSQTVSVAKQPGPNLRRRMWRANDDEDRPAPTAPRDIVEELVQGNSRFRNDDKQSPRQGIQQRSELRTAQHPHTAVLSCSDSRVPPELLFDQGLGDLFVVRNAGEVADEIATASLEYAVEHLHVKHLLILGHESCGAVKAALSAVKGKSAGSKDLDALIKLIKPDLGDLTVASAGQTLTPAVEQHVRAVREKLLKRSKIVREAAEHGELVVHTAIYHLSSGRVELLD